MGYALTGTFQFSALMSFLSGSPFVFIQTYGIDPRAFGLIFGGQVMFLTMGSLLNAKFAPVFGAGRILYWGVCVPLVAGPSALILGLIEVRTGAIGLWPFLACFIAQIASISMIGANSMALALQRYPHMAGTASSLMGVLQFGIGALFGKAGPRDVAATTAQAMELAGLEMSGFSHADADRLLERVRAVRAEDVKAVAARHFGDDALTVVTLDPQPVSGARQPARGFSGRH